MEPIIEEIDSNQSFQIEGSLSKVEIALFYIIYDVGCLSVGGLVGVGSVGYCELS